LKKESGKMARGRVLEKYKQWNIDSSTVRREANKLKIQRKGKGKFVD